MRSWKLHLRSDKAIEDLARMFNPIIRGWLQYYGRYYRSALYPVEASTGPLAGPLGLSEIQEAGRPFAQSNTLAGPNLSARFKVVRSLANGRQAWFSGGSRMSGDVHVRFCESLRGEIPAGYSPQYLSAVAECGGASDEVTHQLP